MSLRRVLILSLIPLAACNALLGIEDLKVRPDAAVGPVEQREQDVTKVQDGGDLSDPPVETGERVDTKEPDAGAKPQVQQPTAAGKDAPTAMPVAGSGGAPAETTSPVTGTVIDSRRRKLTGVSIRIGDQETTTNAEGKFTIPNVASRYDVTIVIQTSITNSATTLAWQFQGLSRRDPTLQVFRGLPENYAEIKSHIDNVTFPLMPDQTILMAWGSPDGDFTVDTTYEDLEYLSPMWTGPALSTGTAHALLMTTSGGVPSQYFAHDARELIMTANMQAQVSFDLGNAIPGTSLVRGSVTDNSGIGERRNEVYLRFRDDSASLKLVDQWSATDNFEYAVPNLPSSTLTVVAKSVTQPPGIAAAYAEVEPGGPFLTLPLPPMASLVAPDAGKTNIDANTDFHWSSGARVVMLCARAVDTYDAIYIVTEAKQTRLPIGVKFGYTPPANAAFAWSIEVHDAYPTIDEATSETGHLSAYATEEIRGPKRGAGTWSRSVPRLFTTAP